MAFAVNRLSLQLDENRASPVAACLQVCDVSSSEPIKLQPQRPEYDWRHGGQHMAHSPVYGIGLCKTPRPNLLLTYSFLLCWSRDVADPALRNWSKNPEKDLLADLFLMAPPQPPSPPWLGTCRCVPLNRTVTKTYSPRPLGPQQRAWVTVGQFVSRLSDKRQKMPSLTAKSHLAFLRANATSEARRSKFQVFNFRKP